MTKITLSKAERLASNHKNRFASHILGKELISLIYEYTEIEERKQWKEREQSENHPVDNLRGCRGQASCGDTHRATQKLQTTPSLVAVNPSFLPTISWPQFLLPAPGQRPLRYATVEGRPFLDNIQSSPGPHFFHSFGNHPAHALYPWEAPSSPPYGDGDAAWAPGWSVLLNCGKLSASNFTGLQPFHWWPLVARLWQYDR